MLTIDTRDLIGIFDITEPTETNRAFIQKNTDRLKAGRPPNPEAARSLIVMGQGIALSATSAQAFKRRLNHDARIHG